MNINRILIILELFPLCLVFMKNVTNFEDKQDPQATLAVN